MPQPRSTFIQCLIKWRFFFVVNLLLIIFLGMTLGREFLRSREIQKEISALQEQADQLAVRNVTLSQLQTAVQTESFIEREARLKLGLKKPGEEMVVVKEEMENGGITGSDGNAKDEIDPLGLVLDKKNESIRVANATKWWYYFFNKSAYSALRSYEN